MVFDTDIDMVFPKVCNSPLHLSDQLFFTPLSSSSILALVNRCISCAMCLVVLISIMQGLASRHVVGYERIITSPKQYS